MKQILSKSAVRPHGGDRCHRRRAHPRPRRSGRRRHGHPIGKLALYTACGGIHPCTTLPVFLDVGTDNDERLADPLMSAGGMSGCAARNTMSSSRSSSPPRPIVGRTSFLQWEDFAKSNATRLLDRYRDRLCTFNDDIQGTAAVATGTLALGHQRDRRAADRAAHRHLRCRLRRLRHRSLLMAAMIEAGVDPKTAASRFYLVDQDGLLVDGMNAIASFQKPFLQDRAKVAAWPIEQPGRVTLLDVVRNAKPAPLIGVSGQPGLVSPSRSSAPWPSQTAGR